MAYSAEISRASPGCFLFLVDQSGSMMDDLEAGITKARFVADALNRTLMQIAISCRKPEGVLDYFDIGVLAYSGEGVQSGLGGALAGAYLSPISAVANNPLRVETRRKKQSDGAGGVVETEVKFPVWFDPQASGGTPMCASLATAHDLLAGWCGSHRRSFPPVVLHVTDGEATDGDETDVEKAAASVASLATDDGNVVLMTLHVTSGDARTIRYPASEAGLPDAYARLMFRASSLLPTVMREMASGHSLALPAGSRAYVFNGQIEDIPTFLDIGTRPLYQRVALPGPGA
ncbi:MAG: VWA domain-containing protein [Acetobacteraceae bacterium]|nr:VWA domain-containing protein [Acetobacteraceae bacterium]